MKERPILFSAPMVLAILDDRKTQTRRVVAVKDLYCDHIRMACEDIGCGGADPKDCHHGKLGDRLWVREAWRPFMEGYHSGVEFRAGGSPSEKNTGGNEDHFEKLYEIIKRTGGDLRMYGAKKDKINLRWRPSIHMYRWMSRITLEITEVRVERLQDISEEDALAEGCESQYGRCSGPMDPPEYDGHSAREEFVSLWESLNAKRATWASNPWVWVLEFKRLKG